MNRRALLAMIVGAIVGGGVVKNVSAEPLRPVTPPIAELFVSVSADVTGAIAGLSSLGNHLNTTSMSFQHVARMACIGPLLICDEYEAQAFIERMAAAIRSAAVR